MFLPSRSMPPPARALLVGAVAGIVAACGGGHLAEVSPEEVPQLEARVAREPGNPAVLTRYAAALFAAERCDTASAVARRAIGMRPDDAVAVLVLGGCQERAGQFEQAIGLYRQFVADHPEARGTGAVQARQMFAFREQATNRARQAIQQEAQLGQEPADPSTVAVLPLAIAGDTSYQALSRGLAQILTSDLALLRRFRMVERLQLTALLDELRLGEGERVDPNTAARVGRLMRAGRMVQGVAAIPPDENVRLEASVVTSGGEVSEAESVTGRLRDLLRLEKDLVVALAGRMGYQLSEAERRAILENGTQNLTAFLAYSRGLVAEDLGDFSRAAAYFSQAVRADPGFQAARQQYQSSAAAPAVQQATAGQVTTVVAQASAEPPTAAPDPTAGAVSSSLGDLAGTRSEQTAVTSQQSTQQSTSTTAAAPPPPPVTPPPTVTGTIRIIFRLP